MAVYSKPLFDSNGAIRLCGNFQPESRVVEHFMYSVQRENQVVRQALDHVLHDAEMVASW